VVLRTARVGLRLTRAQRRRCFGLLLAAGDLWSCVLDMNRWRRQRGSAPMVNFQELCRELHAAGPGTFGELDSKGAEGVLRRFSDAWFSAAKRRKGGDMTARFPRRKRRFLPVRLRYGGFALEGRRLRLAVGRGRPPLWVRLDRDLPYPPGQVRAVTLLADGGRVWVDVTAEVPVTLYPAGAGPDPSRVAGVDPGIIHPYAVAGPGPEGLLVSGRAIRAEHHLHHHDTKHRRRAVAHRAPTPGQRGSRRWKKYRARQRKIEAQHKRRIRQAEHEAARTLVDWAIQHRIGTLKVGDPRGVVKLKAGRRHNRRVNDWRIGRRLRILGDKAEQAGIAVELVDERGTSSTCPNLECRRRVPKPRGRGLSCPHCGFHGHRDLVGAANIAIKNGGGHIIVPHGAKITHRRAGKHLPGVNPARRDPRRGPHRGIARGSPGEQSPAPDRHSGESLASARNP
jgi:IS605 OrfB family transposase